MPRRLPSPLLAALLLAAGLGCRERANGDPERTPPRTRPATAGAPRLLVLIVVDQLPSWSFERSLPHLSGGLARLARESVRYVRAELPWSNTFTASGHAAIATGAAPRDTGMVANEWHHDSAATATGATDDPASPLFGPRPPPGGESSVQLRLDGVADSLERATGGRARTVALGLKDRGAILAIGKKPDVVVWWDVAQRMMTSSKFYGGRPVWLDPARGLVSDPAGLLASTWEPNDAAACEALTGRKDDSSGEGGNHGLGVTFPHSLAAVEDPGKAILNTPFGTRILFESAAAAVKSEALGADDVIDLLSISISSHDYAGHGWGQESWECADVLLDIDRRLGELFAQLDAEVGADRWIGVLTSDHGALRVPQESRGPGGQIGAVLPKPDVVAVARRAAEAVLGKKGGPWCHAVSGNLVHFTPGFRALPEARREKAIAAVLRALRALPGMGLVDRTSALTAEDCDAVADPDRQRACRSLPQGMVEAIYALPASGSQYIGDHPWGAAHGGGSEDERMVPVLFRVPGQPPAVRDETVDFLRIAPTIAGLLGVPPPSGARKPPIALAPPSR
ncbi:MAG TPA: alkaline phosphatase family protein [Kofleriaceae bacterium]|nr:alkaline phosphatase family protein [Kofleriaceae bacterium]